MTKDIKRDTTEILDSQFRIGEQICRLSEHLGLAGNHGPMNNPISGTLEWDSEQHYGIYRPDFMAPTALCQVDTAEKTDLAPWSSHTESITSTIAPAWQHHALTDPDSTPYSSTPSPVDGTHTIWNGLPTPPEPSYLDLEAWPSSSTLVPPLPATPDIIPFEPPKQADPSAEKIRENFKHTIWAATGKRRRRTNSIAESFKRMVQLKAAAVSG